MTGEISMEGQVERVSFENAETGFRVVKVAVDGQRILQTVVGAFPRVTPGARVRVRGEVVQDPRYGEQIRATSVTEILPTTIEGIEKYLGSGLVKGVGPVYAKRIVEAFGADTLRVLEEAPARLAEVQGVGDKRRAAIVDAWREQRGLREVMVFLQSHGAPASLAARIYKRYGDRALVVLSTDPYRLAIDVWGIGFRTADLLATRLGLPRDSEARFCAGILQVLRDQGDLGHTYTLLEGVVRMTLALLESEDAWRVEDAVSLLERERQVVVDARGGNVQDARIAAAGVHRAEDRLARRLAELTRRTLAHLARANEAVRRFEAGAGVALAPEQQAAVLSAAAEGLVVVTGGPGVGKTTLVRAILHLFEAADIGVKLAAPTGRAAKRLAEATGRGAVTLHRLLEFDPKTAQFKRDRNNPIAAGAVIVDETSMVDVYMADALLQAVPDAARLILVGDVDQLPSVGPGAVLHDVLASGVVPSVRLTRIFRQAEESLIVTNAHRINRGELPLGREEGAEGLPSDFFVVKRSDPARAAELVEELVLRRIPRRFGLDPVRDVQVLVPMHKGLLGVVALNRALQAALNPAGRPLHRGEATFREGDKVMQLRNDYEKGVYNGDVGVVSRVDPDEDMLWARFDADGAEVAYDGAEMDELALAYACTVHKSQGSEYPAVVVALLSTHRVMLSKNLLYTAITRGKRLVVLVTDDRAIPLALAEARRGVRRTALLDRLLERVDVAGNTPLPEPGPMG